MAKFTSKDFLDSGLLFEINRTLLHPLGLALGVQVDDETDEAYAIDIRRSDDVEGIIFSEEQMHEGLVKLNMFRAKGENLERYLQRRKALGYIVQPFEPGKSKDDDGDPF